MLLCFVISLWLCVFLVQSQAIDKAHMVSVPIRHSLPDSRTEPVFGSSVNGNCLSVINDASQNHSGIPVHRGSICNGTSVLNDGVVPALSNISDDSRSLWAAQLLTMKQGRGTRIVLSFEVENQLYNCMELAVFNCPDMGMNTSSIIIYRDTSFRPERVNESLGTVIKANHPLSNMSCDYLLKFYVSLMPQVNSSYFNVEFPGLTSDNYVFVGEVSFLSMTGARDCQQMQPELIETTNCLLDSKWLVTDNLTCSQESSIATTDYTLSTGFSTSSTSDTPQNSQVTLTAAIAAMVVIFLTILVVVFLVIVVVYLRNHKRKTYKNNNIQYSMTEANKESETRFSNSVHKAATINSEQQTKEFMPSSNVPVLDGIYSNPDEIQNVASSSFIERKSSFRPINQEQQKLHVGFCNQADVIISSARHSPAPVSSKHEDDHKGVIYAIPNKKKHTIRESLSSLSSRAEFEVSTEAILQNIPDDSDTKGLYESVDSVQLYNQNGSSNNLLNHDSTITGTEQPIVTVSSDIPQPPHFEDGILDTDAIYAEPLDPPSMNKLEWDPDQGIYESIYSEALKPSLFMQETECTGKDVKSEDLYPYSSIYTVPDAPSTNKPLLVSVQNIKMIKHLGNGNFGQVVLAQTVNLSPQQLQLESQAPFALVAVKRLKANASEGTKELFEKEVKFMSRLNHPNVVRLLGVCTDEENPFIMMEYMKNGDLNQYLKGFNSIGEGAHKNVKPISMSTLTNISVQIASAMQYLAVLNFVHRDLATRNCLVGSKNTVKISDFGMSRGLYESHYYIINGHAILPIRWMATECFYGKFSAKTDVWAFGITMWEIFTLAKEQPYNHLLDQEVVEDAIKGPNRTLLKQPAECPQDIFDVMKACWLHDAGQRPTFDELYKMLSN